MKNFLKTFFLGLIGIAAIFALVAGGMALDQVYKDWIVYFSAGLVILGCIMGIGSLIKELIND